MRDLTTSSDSYPGISYYYIQKPGCPLLIRRTRETPLCRSHIRCFESHRSRWCTDHERGEYRLGPRTHDDFNLFVLCDRYFRIFRRGRLSAWTFSTYHFSLSFYFFFHSFFFLRIKKKKRNWESERKVKKKGLTKTIILSTSQMAQRQKRFALM